MDERQTKIREGAGLEESRINTELIDFLNKWSSPVLIVIGLIGLGWFGWNYLERSKVAKQNNAFAAFEDAVAGENPAPTSLRGVALEYAGVGSVAELALLRTVDIYLRAAITGVEPGAQIDPATGQPEDERDVLDGDGVRGYLSQARDLSRQVAESTRDRPGRELIQVQAQIRLGAALEGLGSVDEARSAYSSAAGVARAAGFPALARLAERRAELADRLGAGMASLPSRAALAPLPGEEPMDEPGIDIPMSLDELLSMPFMQDALRDGELDPSELPDLPDLPELPQPEGGQPPAVPVLDPPAQGDGSP